MSSVHSERLQYYSVSARGRVDQSQLAVAQRRVLQLEHTVNDMYVGTSAVQNSAEHSNISHTAVSKALGRQVIGAVGLLVGLASATASRAPVCTCSTVHMCTFTVQLNAGNCSRALVAQKAALTASRASRADITRTCAR